MLRFPYVVNLLILVPVCLAMAAQRDGGMGTVFSGKVAASDGLRLIVWSMWMAILLGSLAGLVWPARMAPLLALQVIYKALWLALFVLPVWRDGGWSAVPQGIALSFAFIVLVWPWFVWRLWRG